MRTAKANKKLATSFILTHLFRDRKSTRLNSSHLVISYAVFCLKKNTPRMTVRTLRDSFGKERSEVRIPTGAYPYALTPAPTVASSRRSANAYGGCCLTNPDTLV